MNSWPPGHSLLLRRKRVEDAAAVRDVAVQPVVAGQAAVLEAATPLQRHQLPSPTCL
jgi:hypothetical protein